MYTKYNKSNKIYTTDSKDIEKEWLELPAGVYTLGHCLSFFGMTPTFETITPIDKLVNFRSGIIGEIIDKCDEFFNERTKAIYAELNMCQKMGILMHGAPGTGKTCSAMLVMEMLAQKYGAVCLDIGREELNDTTKFIKSIRNTQKSPIVLFMDEFDEWVREGSSDESQMLKFLDGNDSIDGLVVIGCTNYIDKVPSRIKKRKSRIKHIFEIKSLPIEVYKQYIEDRFPKMNRENTSKFAYIAEERNLTLDQLKHAVIDHAVEQIPIEEAIESVLTT